MSIFGPIQPGLALARRLVILVKANLRSTLLHWKKSTQEIDSFKLWQDDKAKLDSTRERESFGANSSDGFGQEKNGPNTLQSLRPHICPLTPGAPQGM